MAKQMLSFLALLFAPAHADTLYSYVALLRHYPSPKILEESPETKSSMGLAGL